MAARYFSNQKKGELVELRDELNSKEKDIKRDAVKKVIAMMTVGQDVSRLFTDVLKCMAQADIELKKLVYLYLMNYAKSQPDLAILAVNSFVKDAKDPNPLIRALAIRTMSSIRVDEVTSYLCEPLRAALKDEDPYVRKTAAVSVAKLFEIDPDLTEDQGFIEDLRELLQDGNAMVVANTVASLSEISEVNPRVFVLNEEIVNSLLTAINECTEWGQTFILDALVRYQPKDSHEAESIIDRVASRLSHANSAVVLSAVKIIIKFLDLVHDQDYVTMMCSKMSPALVTLLSSEPEIQYIALRNMIFIMERLPEALRADIRTFFCRFDDPIFVKMEKLEMLMRLVSETNVDQVLTELREYASEVDVDFVRKSVRAIGRTAIKIPGAADKAVHVLVSLIKTKVSYVVQEAVVVIKDIFRKFPDDYESVIGPLCENLDSLDEPDAKASLFWIIGEYADRIENAAEILETFVDSFVEEPAQVQLQLLGAIVKLYLCFPDENQKLLEYVLKLATQEVDNPDLRDRAFVYWRLMIADADTAKNIVLAEKPPITSEAPPMDRRLLRTLVDNIGTLASVFHRPPEQFVTKLKLAVPKVQNISSLPGDDDLDAAVARVAHDDDEEAAPEKESSNADVDNILIDLANLGAPTTAPAAGAPAGVRAPSASSGLDDLLGLGIGSSPAPAPAAAAAANSAVILSADAAQGLEIRGRFVPSGEDTALQLSLTNRGGQMLSGFQIQFNKNALGLAPATVNLSVEQLAPGASAQCSVALNAGQLVSDDIKSLVQIAFKTNLGVFFGGLELNLDGVLVESGRLARDQFLKFWGSVPDEQETQLRIPTATNPDALQAALERANLFQIARRKPADYHVCYFSGKLVNKVVYLVEVTVEPSALQVCVRSNRQPFNPLLVAFLQQTLSGAL